MIQKIDEAIELIKRGFVKGSIGRDSIGRELVVYPIQEWKDRGTCFCLFGALEATCMVIKPDSYIIWVDVLKEHGINIIEAVLEFTNGKYKWVSNFNDAPETTAEDAILFLEFLMNKFK